jgi:hypothetical protein
MMNRLDFPIAEHSFAQKLKLMETLWADMFVNEIDILPHLDDETVATLRRKGRGFLLRSGVALSLP